MGNYVVDFYDMIDGWIHYWEMDKTHQFDNLEKAKKLCDEKNSKVGQSNKNAGEHWGVIDFQQNKLIYGRPKGPMPFFIVEREADGDGNHWAYIDRCPHGHDLGSIHFGPKLGPCDGTGKFSHLIWKFEDLGNGRCRINPSILAKGIHGGQDCHFGPGEFEFMWIEKDECRNTEPFASRYRERTGREP